MWSSDITFCKNNKCPHTKCMRYYTNAPTTHPCSMAFFPRRLNGDCDYRFDTDWETVEDVQILEEHND